MFDYTVQFAYLRILYGALPLVVAAAWYRWKYYQAPVYRYSFVSALVQSGAHVKTPYKKILNVMRFVALIGLALLIARPQLVDEQSKVHVDGIDIMLLLDVSGSMQLFDDLRDRRPRIEIAKQEAINFVKKRDNDPIGLVLFGNEAVSRCPATLDKKMLESIIKDTQLGVINPDGTMITKGLVMALNRLRRSKSESKIIILLTDGEPTPGDLDPRAAVELAKKYNIKIYTIGIGSEGGYFEHPMFGTKRIGMPLNTQLLSALANNTGGKFFEAKKTQDLARIYDEIDTLEKTEYETDVYHKYYDVFMPFLWALIGLVCLELFLGRFVWFGI
jgi:Ca-activated chloride channel homolog